MESHITCTENTDDNAKSDTIDDRRDCDEDVDDDAIAADDRVERYVGETSDVFKSKSLNVLKPFYNGATLDDRMKEIRKSIYYIRHNWGKYNEFLLNLKTFVSETCEMKFCDPVTKRHAERLLSMERDWLKSGDVSKNDVTYDAIQLYTSQEGYNAIYGLSNKIFRTEDSIAAEYLIRNVVFLVDLINIDLHNYCMVCPEKKDFEGVVYRGLTVTEEDIRAFRSLRSCPIDERNIAVPLGLLSSSSNINVAKKFIKQQLKRQKLHRQPLLKPLLEKIHVLNLKQEYTDHYTKAFPTSELSTICAVDIHDLSRYRGESEVLLRGPFRLILDLYEDATGLDGSPCLILEAVMLNNNRDHISTSFLGVQDGAARELIECMRAVDRSEFALNYCTEKGLTEDVRQYGTYLAANRARLERLMGTVNPFSVQ